MKKSSEKKNCYLGGRLSSLNDAAKTCKRLCIYDTKSGAKHYRYGFNGKENDWEAKGWQNQVDYGMRPYDPRIGRFFSVDPLTKSYPWYTPYQFAGNSPIANIDLDGAEPQAAGKEEGQTGTTDHSMHTGGGHYEKYQKTWYWHAGGLGTGKYTYEKNSKGETISRTEIQTQAGWYSSEEYVGVLSKTNAVRALATDLNLYNASAGMNNHNLGKAREELEKFAGGGLNDKAFSHLLAAAQADAKKDNYFVSGHTYPSGFNVEDMLGVGVLIKQGLTFLGKSATNTIYRVVTREEATDFFTYGFRQAPLSSKISSYEGKLFWTTGKDAAWFKNWAGSGNVTLKIKTDKSFIFENGTDAGRLFYYVSPERLEQFNKAIRSATIK